MRGVRTGAVGGAGLLVAVVLSLLFGRDFVGDMAGGGGGPTSQLSPGELQTTPEEEQLVDFMSFALDHQQQTWRELLGSRYQEATLVLYRAGTSSGCGYGEAAVGPFYCPADGKVYLDLSFFQQLSRRLGAPGDFAQAYVLAHEIGHHVQNISGLMERGRGSNAASVRTELQADCFAGVWGHHAERAGHLERGDLEEGLRAAAAIGDDALAAGSGRRVRPESFTHGSSAQRVEWFRRGFAHGRPTDCDTSRDVATR
jgi:uncharacterized protein